MTFVKPLRRSDWLIAENLWVESWQLTMPAIDFEARRDWFKIYLPELQATGFTLLGAYTNNQLLGFMAINAQTYVLDQITVAHHAKGQGIAQALINAAKQQSPRIITLKVNADNCRAIAFYEKHGFAKTGIEGVNALSGLNYMEMEWSNHK